jgi:hypothetical protein
MRDAPTERLPRRHRLNRSRLATWIGMTVVLMVGAPLTDILSWAWALLLLFALILAAQIVSWHWLHPTARRPWDDDA